MNHQPVAGSTLAALLSEARQAALNAYAPYSKFRVGAALLLANGKTVIGANVENASFGLTICAERAALVAAIAEYGPAIRIEAVAIANLNAKPSPPCGACRQMLSEFIECCGVQIYFFYQRRIYSYKI